MFDWQVQEEDDSPIRAPEERPSRQLYRWRLVGGLLLLLVVAALLLFRWRLNERQEVMEVDLTPFIEHEEQQRLFGLPENSKLSRQQEVMEADLKAFIQHEEQQRLFGLPENSKHLLAPDVPKVWQRDYLKTFANPDDLPPVDVLVEEIDLSGTEAYVTMRVDNVVQIRFYRLIGQGWRRAPLPDEFWGERRQIELPDFGLPIAYRARDEGFVKRLVDELPPLLGEGKIASKMITVLPYEFGPPLLHKGGEVAINSPKVVIAERLDGETAVRLALAYELLARTSSEGEVNDVQLSNIQAFRAAIYTILVLRSALPDEAIPRQIWHQAAATGDKSPFLEINPKAVSLETVWQPDFSEAMFLLVVDYLYDEIGREGLQRVLKELPTAQSWDSLFYPLTGRYTIELEAEMANAKVVRDLSQKASQLRLQPFDATLLEVDSETGALKVEVPGQDESLLIQGAEEAAVVAPDGQALPTGCAALFSELTITVGDWLQFGQEFKARQIAVRELSPFVPFLPESTPAPANTLAYLAEAVPGREGNWLANLIALAEDGSTTHLMSFSSPLQSISNPQRKAAEPQPFLLSWSVPNCEQAWLFQYDPMKGMTARWLTLPAFSAGLSEFVWRLPQQDILLFSASTSNNLSPNNWQIVSLAPGTQLRPERELEPGWRPLAWRSASQQIVAFTTQNQQAQVKLFSHSSEAQTIVLAEYADFMLLSRDGNRLFYAVDAVAWYHDLSQQPAIRMLDLSSGEDTLLIQALDSERLWPTQEHKERLLFFSGPREFAEFTRQRLLLVELAQPNRQTVLAEVAENSQITNAMFCSEDRVLYTVESEGQSELYLWQADGSTKSLLRSDKELQLLSCR